MEKLANRRKVFDSLQEAVRADKARSTILQISELGLVQMTRKRTRESLGQLLLEPCPHCDGLGRLRSAVTIAYDALRRLTRAAADDGGGLVLLVHPVVAAVLQADGAQHVRAIATRFGRPARVEARPEFARDEIRIERD